MSTSTSALDSAWNDYVEREIFVNPLPLLHRLRDERPAYLTPSGFWLFTRYDDVYAVLRGDAGIPFAKGVEDNSKQAVDTENFFKNHFIHNILYYDPPAHTRLRRLMFRAFTPQAIERIRVQTRQFIEELLDEIESRGTRQMDVIKDLAKRVPTSVILRLLDLPDDEFERMDEMARCVHQATQPGVDPESWMPHANEVYEERHEFFLRLAEQRLRDPGDDLVSHLALARAQDPTAISEIELTTNIGFLVIAGFDTTLQAIGTGTRLLLDHPDQLKLMRTEPSLLPGVVEEILRYAPPLPLAAPRYVAADVEFAGVSLGRGDKVHISIEGANHDPKYFPDPDVFDVTRDPAAHRQLTFAQGSPHHCLGAHLARMELGETLAALFARFPNLHLAGEPEPRRSMFLRGYERLPVAW